MTYTVSLIMLIFADQSSVFYKDTVTVCSFRGMSEQYLNASKWERRACFVIYTHTLDKFGRRETSPLKCTAADNEQT